MGDDGGRTEDEVAAELRRDIAALRLQPADSHHNDRAVLRAVFDGSLEAMLLANDDGVYVDASSVACELFRPSARPACR